MLAFWGFIQNLEPYDNLRKYKINNIQKNSFSLHLVLKWLNKIKERYLQNNLLVFNHMSI